MVNGHIYKIAGFCCMIILESEIMRNPGTVLASGTTEMWCWSNCLGAVQASKLGLISEQCMSVCDWLTIRAKEHGNGAE